MDLILPKFGDREDVARALKDQEAVIAAKKAELDMAYTILNAIRKMCKHEYYRITFCGRDAGQKCEHCGDVKA
jgi:hypothetical protein